MKKEKGFFTLIEILVIVFIALIAIGGISSAFINNRGATEARAYAALDNFVAMNNITVKRKTCAGDSDGDGYGSCAIVTSDGERMRISCPTNWSDINLWGATSCKEEFQDIMLSR